MKDGYAKVQPIEWGWYCCEQGQKPISKSGERLIFL